MNIDPITIIAAAPGEVDPTVLDRVPAHEQNQFEAMLLNSPTTTTQVTTPEARFVDYLKKDYLKEQSMQTEKTSSSLTENTIMDPLQILEEQLTRTNRRVAVEFESKFAGGLAQGINKLTSMQ